jgi:hypothetical protein
VGIVGMRLTGQQADVEIIKNVLEILLQHAVHVPPVRASSHAKYAGSAITYATVDPAAALQRVAEIAEQTAREEEDR